LFCVGVEIGRSHLGIRVFENTVLRGIFGFKTDEVKESGENYIRKRLMICILHPIFIG